MSADPTSTSAPSLSGLHQSSASASTSAPPSSAQSNSAARSAPVTSPPPRALTNTTTTPSASASTSTPTPIPSSSSISHQRQRNITADSDMSTESINNHSNNSSHRQGLPTPAISPTTMSPTTHSQLHDNDTEQVTGGGTGSSGGPRKRNQVKRACVNCQKACKKCDNGRPCGRCIKFGLETTCADSARKERQRVGVKRGRSASVESGTDGSSPVHGWSKLDILSRLCHTVLMHAAESGDDSADMALDEPELLAARSLSIIANRSRGVELDDLPDSPDPSPDPLDYEYDHQSFDHSDLVQEGAQKVKSPFGNINVNSLAATLSVAGLSAAANGTNPMSALASLYPFSAFAGLEALAGVSNAGTQAKNDTISPGVRFAPFAFSGFNPLAAFETPVPPPPKVREPNPLDDFAAISDTVRRMEDEAYARSKKRKAPAATSTLSTPLPPLPSLSLWKPSTTSSASAPATPASSETASSSAAASVTAAVPTTSKSGTVSSGTGKRTRRTSTGMLLTPAPTRVHTPAQTPAQTPGATPSQTPAVTPSHTPATTPAPSKAKVAPNKPLPECRPPAPMLEAVLEEPQQPPQKKQKQKRKSSNAQAHHAHEQDLFKNTPSSAGVYAPTAPHASLHHALPARHQIYISGKPQKPSHHQSSPPQAQDLPSMVYTAPGYPSDSSLLPYPYSPHNSSATGGAYAPASYPLSYSQYYPALETANDMYNQSYLGGPVHFPPVSSTKGSMPMDFVYNPVVLPTSTSPASLTLPPVTPTPMSPTLSSSSVGRKSIDRRTPMIPDTGVVDMFTGAGGSQLVSQPLQHHPISHPHLPSPSQLLHLHSYQPVPSPYLSPHPALPLGHPSADMFSAAPRSVAPVAPAAGPSVNSTIKPTTSSPAPSHHHHHSQHVPEFCLPGEQNLLDSESRVRMDII
ncbi:hypothetical protein PhCBS80983_g04400 [Powellomyces hirtus]|uniref:Zn(2)-C6 fungal-type domain-containing protein n=1 Tax=Powellomyces hirtus TaxID=109895 RepID=A0A507DZ15_9FUNG|nr:hypothetical protein PhCBS80983_g04400 [Powellomyces hirtus]